MSENIRGVSRDGNLSKISKVIVGNRAERKPLRRNARRKRRKLAIVIERIASCGMLSFCY